MTVSKMRVAIAAAAITPFLAVAPMASATNPNGSCDSCNAGGGSIGEGAVFKTYRDCDGGMKSQYVPGSTPLEEPDCEP